MPDTADVPVQAGRPVGRRPKPRRPPTIRDMILSLVVIGVGIGLFVLLLPSSPHQKVEPVSYLPTAKALAAGSAIPIYAPDPLPPGWVANYVRVGPGPSALHIGFVLSAKRFARLDESAKPDASFYADANIDPNAVAGAAAPVPDGLALPSGFELHRNDDHVVLIRRFEGGGVLAVSDGGSSSGASLAELVSLARSLQPQRA